MKTSIFIIKVLLISPVFLFRYGDNKHTEAKKQISHQILLIYAAIYSTITRSSL